MALTQTEVSKLYVAIFNRASEGEGNQYWQEQNLSLAETADTMLATPDAQDYFGDKLNDDKAFVEWIYQNTFDKTYEDDPDGIDYWVGELATKSRGEVVAGIVTAAESPENAGPAQDQFLHRVTVSNFAAEHIEKAPENYGKVLGFKDDNHPDNNLDVTADGDTVGSAEDIVNALTKGGETIKLSTGMDMAGQDASDNVDGHFDQNLNLTALDEKIDATELGSLQVGDVIQDPSTSDHDVLVANLAGDLGVNDPNGDSDPATHFDLPEISGPVIENIEEILLADDDLASVINLDGVKGTQKLYIDSEDNEHFNSLNDIALLEIANLDGEQVGELIAVNRTQNLAVSDVRNDADITLKDDFKNLVLDAYAEDANDDKVTVNLKGADINLGLFNDDDDRDGDANGNDGGAFQKMTLASSDNASTITLMEGTALNNITDDTTGNGGAANKAAEDTDGAGKDATGTEGSMRTIAANDGHADSNLAAELLLDGDQDITLAGTGIQFDEARISENDDDAMTSVIDLTLQGANEINAPVDLTWAQVDRVDVAAKGDDAVTPEWMEIDADQDSIVRVNEIADLDTLVITGDNKYDMLDIEINTGNADAALGRLVLGGDASATTTDFIPGTTTASGQTSGSEGNGTPASTTPQTADTETADAQGATVTVLKDSNLGVLDISQITGPKVTLTGDADLRVYELIMGNGGPGDGDRQANTLDARTMTGDLTVNLTALNIKTPDNSAPDSAYDDGNGVDDNAAAGTFNGGAADNGAGVTLLLGNGDDAVMNAAVVGDKEGEWDHTDNIDLGFGNDVVEIGSMDPLGNHNDDAVGAEIWGGTGKDTFIFRSASSTDEGQLAAGSQFKFADVGAADSQAPVADDKGADDQTGVSLVQIEDFNAGRGASGLLESLDADQISFQLFRDVDGEGLNKDDVAATPELFHNGEVLDANGTDRYVLDDGEVALVRVDDIEATTAADIKALFGDTVKGKPAVNPDDTAKDDPADGTIARLFEDSDVNKSAPASQFNENIIIAGEATGDDGVKIFYVREGGNAQPSVDNPDPVVDHLEVTLIGQLNGTADNELNINSLTVDNFDFA